jgi:hypothetical protein
MMLVDSRPQTGLQDVRIDLSSRYIGVPQHSLYAAEVRATFQQVRGEAVPDHVGSQLLPDAGLPAVSGQ